MGKICGYFALEDIELANKPMKKCSKLVIREMQIKITSYHYTSIISMIDLKSLILLKNKNILTPFNGDRVSKQVY